MLKCSGHWCLTSHTVSDASSQEYLFWMLLKSKYGSVHGSNSNETTDTYLYLIVVPMLNSLALEFGNLMEHMKLPSFGFAKTVLLTKMLK